RRQLLRQAPDVDQPVGGELERGRRDQDDASPGRALIAGVVEERAAVAVCDVHAAQAGHVPVVIDLGLLVIDGAGGWIVLPTCRRAARVGAAAVLAAAGTGREAAFCPAARRRARAAAHVELDQQRVAVGEARAVGRAGRGAGGGVA